MPKTKAAFLLLVALGLGLSVYLLTRHYTLATTSGPVAPSTCSAVLKRDCDGALQSPVSKQFGLPLAAWGVVYYATLATLLLLGWFLGDAFRFEAAILAFVLAMLGAVLSVVLFVTMMVGNAPFCPLCAATHAINLLLLPICKRLTGLPIRELMRTLGTGIVAVLAGDAVSNPASRIKLLGTLTAALVAAALYQWLVIQEKLHPPAEFNINHAIATFALTPRAEIPVGDDNPRLGPDDAWVRLVVFTDFQCQGCRRLAASLGPLVQGYHPRVQVVFKHFPVSTTCNPALKEDHHPLACDAAWAAEAARLQGKFWPFQDALFAANLDSEQVIEDMARQVGLDMARFQTDRASEAVRARVKADIELGLHLGVDETPAIFINGRRAPDVRMWSINQFILSEMASRTQVPFPAPKGAKDGKDTKDGAKTPPGGK